MWPFTRAAARRAAVERIAPTVKLLPVAQQAGKRSFVSAVPTELTADLPTSIFAINAALRYNIYAMRSRSRWLARNNDYYREWLRSLRRSVVGAKGFGLQPTVKQPPAAKAEAGAKPQPDVMANRLIRQAFDEWSGAATCTVEGSMDRPHLERLLITLLGRDGEFLLRKVRGADVGGRFGYSLQVIPIDLLDEQLNVGVGGAPPSNPGGNVGWAQDHEIRMGVQRDKWKRPFAYWLRTWYPGDDPGMAAFQNVGRWQVVPADEIEHVFEREDAAQARGFPRAASSITRLNQIGGYEDAVVVGARVGASSMGFLEGQNTDEVKGDTTGAEGELLNEVVPGTVAKLPNGVTFKSFNPSQPASTYAEGRKGFLRGVAAGMGANYHSIGKDYESVNFSSLRAAAMDDREEWKILQDLLLDMWRRIVSDWLSHALLRGAINLPLGKFDKFNDFTLHPRGWDWVDPVAEITAAATEVALGVKSRRQICEARGLDFDQIMDDQGDELRVAKSKGVDLWQPEPRLPKGVTATTPPETVAGAPKPVDPPAA
ncbi:MAG TPA: phage portal protein [Reyranella sp.]|nr:phage portal protein [Reyranella sp.]